MNKDAARSWESVCRDCRNYRAGRCGRTNAFVDPDDPIAAICLWFKPPPPWSGRRENQSTDKGQKEED